MADQSPYDALGGEPTLHALVQRFYELMDTLPEAAAARSLHPPSLANAQQKLFEFLCGWLGGPQYYVEKYGHPRMRARHMPFAIGNTQRDAWLLCMQRAADEILPEGPARAHFIESVTALADHMRNC